MKKQSIILLMMFLSLGICFTSCNKKRDEIKPDAENNSKGMQLQAVTCAYTIKATQSTVDGSQLNLPPGSFVCIEAGTRGPLYLKNFNGEPGKPITFINGSGGQAILKGNGTSWALKVGYSKNIRFTGTGSSNEYGIVIDGGNNGFTLPELTTDFEIDHVEVKNCGFAGIMGKTDPKCDPATWRTNFTMRNVSLHDNYIHDVKGEGFYIGNSFYNGKSESCGTVYPHEIHGLKIYKNIVRNSGCEGIQVGCARYECEVYDNVIENPGRDPFAAYQNNGLQIGAGTGGKCYNNIIKNAPGNGMIVNGVGGNLVYNNLILNSGELGIFCDERTEPNEGFSFINNTIVNSGTDGMRLYCEKVPMNNIINNIIINPKSGRYINLATGVKVNNQNNYTSMDAASVKFANISASNYSLVSGSPAINAGSDVSSYGIAKDLFNSVRPYDTKYDVGAYEFIGVNIPDPNTDPDPVDTTTANPGTITSLTLVNADTEKDIAVLTNGYVIDFAKIGTKNLNVRANTNPFPTGSVRFALDANTNYKTENGTPYTMAGDANGDYNAWVPSIGAHTITATCYSGTAGAGTKGTPFTIAFTVQTGTVVTDPVTTPTITSLTLINADTEKDIAVLTDGYVIDFAKIGTKNLNVRANTNPYPTGSVIFSLDAISNFKTESGTPYALGGDASGGYNSWVPSLGSHTIIATPYTGTAGAGTKGTPLTVAFTVQTGTVVTNPVDTTVASQKLYPQHDAYLDGTKPYDNAYLRAEAGKRVSYMKYTIAGLGATKPKSAKIRFKVADGGIGNVKIGLGSHSNWTETTISSTNKPTIIAPVSSLNVKYVVGRIYELDVASAITGDGTYTFIITLEGADDVAFSSGEGNYRPELLISK